MGLGLCYSEISPASDPFGPSLAGERSSPNGAVRTRGARPRASLVMTTARERCLALVDCRSRVEQGASGRLGPRTFGSLWKLQKSKKPRARRGFFAFGLQFQTIVSRCLLASSRPWLFDSSEILLRMSVSPCVEPNVSYRQEASTPLRL
jgi:hypothetical protein